MSEDAAEAARLEKERRVAQMDLFALCTELGERGQQYDVEADGMVDTFVRGEDCLECLRQISKWALCLLRASCPIASLCVCVHCPLRAPGS